MITQITYRYVQRLETLVGREVATQYNELAKRSKGGKLDQLRNLKKQV